MLLIILLTLLAIISPSILSYATFKDRDIVGGIFYALIALVGCALIILFIVSLIEEPKSLEYSTSEYKLEYKITTIGEKSDTTYVLTRYE